MHTNDWAAGKRGVLWGEGEVNWQGVFDAAETVGGARWYIVEQETYPTTPLGSVEVSFTNLRKLLAARRG